MMTRRRPFVFANVLTVLVSASCASDKAGAPTDHGDSHISGTGAPVLAAGTGTSSTGTAGIRGVTAGRPGTAGSTGISSGRAGQGGSTPAAVGGAGAATGGSLAIAGAGAAGSGGAGAPTTPSMCMSKAPKEFELNTKIGGGGSNHMDSPHFALYNATNPDLVLNFMEAAHKCFIEDWCFRTPGLSSKSDDSGPYYKTNLYSIAGLNAGGLTDWDASAELASIRYLSTQINDPKTSVHEYGHAITMSEHNWIDQKRTGYWWETVANWVAYSFLSSPYCADARTAFNVKEGTTIIDQMHTLDTIYGQSYTVICNDQNYYQAWPFLMYLTNNPDNYPGLGKMAVADLMRKYELKSNETPLHTLNRIAAPITTQTIMGRYWARLAYMDIGFPLGQKDFMTSRAKLNYTANLDSAGADTYMVKAARKPQYGGANMTPLKVSGSGDVSVTVTNLGNGLMESNFTATLSIRAADGSVRYVDLPKGVGQATIASTEEATLVVVNTPDMLYLFDPQSIKSPENVGLNYKVQITGAAPTN